MNRSPKVTILQGEPGTGKSLMACRTAVNPPVHVVDIDRKVRSAGWAQSLIESKQLTYWELNESYDDENVKARLEELVGNEHSNTKPRGPRKMPQGITRFAEYMYSLPSTEEGKAAGTWCIDSCTLLNNHVIAHISYLADHNKFQFDEWFSLQQWWISTTSFLKDQAKEHGKDLIFMVHERVGEKAGDRTSGVEYTVDAKGNRQRILLGKQDLRIWASISGAFGELFGAVADEYYHLFIDIENGRPKWRCRIHPDGVRALRTSFIHSEAVHEPDFRKIWR